MRNKYLVLIYFTSWFVIFSVAFTFGQPLCAFGQQEPTFPSSSPNPVGSGARALGMGSAFIGVADDATAASWNPGGLIQVERPEASFVVNGFHRVEDNTFRTEPEADGNQSVSDEMKINYLSLTLPFILFDKNMSFAMNYQHLYDFSREWNLSMDIPYDIPSIGVSGIEKQDWFYLRDGSLSAVGLSYCIEPIQNVSFGFTLNIWSDDWCKWDEHTRYSGVDIDENGKITRSFTDDIKNKYFFRGTNANIGILWTVPKISNEESSLGIGLIFKSPFKADLREIKDHHYKQDSDTNPIDQPYPTEIHNKKLRMPGSWGIGVAYRHSDKLTFAADIYKTQWDEFYMTGAKDKDTLESIEISPITNKDVGKSQIDSTWQVRMGVEKLFYDENQRAKNIWALRGGLFYDPVPSEGSPDNFFGISLGGGFITNRCSFDFALECRWGYDSGHLMVDEYYNFSQNVKEVTAYLSVVYYIQDPHQY